MSHHTSTPTSRASPSARFSSSLADVHMRNDDQTHAHVKVDLSRSPSIPSATSATSTYNDVFTHAATAHAAATTTPQKGSRWTITPPLPSLQRIEPYHPTQIDYDFNFNFNSYYDQEQDELIQLPITPPRKAPVPPVYAPRRQRARHIKMKPPAKSGLFTLEEEDEQVFAGLGKRLSSNSSMGSTSGVSLVPSGLSGTSGTSGSGSGSGSEEEPGTPSHDLMDPFGPSEFPMDVDMEMDIEVRTPVHPTISGYTPFSAYYTYTYDYPSPSPLVSSTPTSTQMPTLAASLSGSAFKPRRPPPLNLSVITDPNFHLITEQNRTPTLPHHRSNPNSKSSRSRTQRKEGKELMPSLPILSPEEYSATSSRGMGMGMDLDEVFDELLMSAGELEGDMFFPLPPPRSPLATLSRNQQRQARSPRSHPRERQESPSTPITPALQTPITPPAVGRSLYPPGAPGPKRSKPRQHSTLTSISPTQSNSSLCSYSPYGDREDAGERERGSPIGLGLGLGLGLGMGFGGDHSFLLSLSRESSPITTSPSSSFTQGFKRPLPTSVRSISSPLPTSSSSLASSNSSANASARATSRQSSTKSKKLPTRKGLPSHWTDNVI